MAAQVEIVKKKICITLWRKQFEIISRTRKIYVRYVYINYIVHCAPFLAFMLQML